MNPAKINQQIIDLNETSQALQDYLHTRNLLFTLYGTGSRWNQPLLTETDTLLDMVTKVVNHYKERAERPPVIEEPDDPHIPPDVPEPGPGEQSEYFLDKSENVDGRV